MIRRLETTHPDDRGLAGRALKLAASVPNWVVTDVVAPFLATRLLLVVVTFVAERLVGVTGSPADPRTTLTAAWSRWDGGWYLSVAMGGYSYTGDERSNVAFFPLYPLLIKGAATLVGRTDLDSFAFLGMVISNAALVTALVYLVRLVRLDFDHRTAARTVLYILVFPSSFFLSAVYAESLFLALSVASFYYARQGRWWLAGALGAAAALSRPQGFLLAVPLAYEYLHQRGFQWRRLRPSVLGVGLVPAGLALYLAYLGWRFGNPFVYTETQARGWGREIVVPWQTFANVLSGPAELHDSPHSRVDLAASVVLLAPIVAAWRVVRPSYAVLLAAFFLGTLSTGTLQSILRYPVGWFPLFVVLAVAGRSRVFDTAYLTAALALLCVFMGMFATNYWVA